jgi:hypothetical protein
MHDDAQVSLVGQFAEPLMSYNVGGGRVLSASRAIFANTGECPKSLAWMCFTTR